MKEKFYTSLKILIGIVIFGIFVHKNTNASSNTDNRENSYYHAEKLVDRFFDKDELENVSQLMLKEDTITILIDVENYRISEAGKEFIKRYEDCRLTSYRDLGGGYTIGYGHHTKEVKKGMKISQKQADDFFNEDIKKTEEYARKLIKDLPYRYNFSQEFFDGLCDLIYNAGPGAVQRSEFYKRLKNCRVIDNKINQEDYEYVISAVKFLNAPYKGHKIRRQECHDNMVKSI